MSNLNLSIDEILDITNPKKTIEKNLQNKLVGLLMLAPSTRTRLSFIRAIINQNLNYVCLNKQDLRLVNGESIKDTANAISKFCDLIAIRNHSQLSYSKGNIFLEEFIKYSKIPVINLECDRYHPCQALSDLRTIREIYNNINKITINISWAYSPTALRVPAMPIELLLLFSRVDANIILSHPEEFNLESKDIEMARTNCEELGSSFTISNNMEPANYSEIVYARNWTSFVSNSKQEELKIHAKYKNWSYNPSNINANGYYMHCLPVDRGNEASDELIDSAQSLINRQMENRVIIQELLLNLLLNTE